MKYEFLVEKKEELLNDRIISKLSDKIGLSNSYLTLILNGQRCVNFPLAYTISSFIGGCNNVYYYFKIVERV